MNRLVFFEKKGFFTGRDVSVYINGASHAEIDVCLPTDNQLHAF